MSRNYALKVYLNTLSPKSIFTSKPTTLNIAFISFFYNSIIISHFYISTFKHYDSSFQSPPSSLVTTARVPSPPCSPSPRHHHSIQTPYSPTCIRTFSSLNPSRPTLFVHLVQSSPSRPYHIHTTGRISQPERIELWGAHQIPVRRRCAFRRCRRGDWKATVIDDDDRVSWTSGRCRRRRG